MAQNVYFSFVSFRQPYPRANKGLLPTEEGQKLHCSIAKMVHLVAQSFSWRHNTILQDFLLKRVYMKSARIVS